jgi:cell division protease FtsH
VLGRQPKSLISPTLEAVPEEDGAEAGEADTALIELARSMSGVFQAIRRLAPEAKDSDLIVRLEDHLGVHPQGLPILSQEIPSYQLVDLQIALEKWSEEQGRGFDVLGISGEQRRFHPLSELITQGTRTPDGILMHAGIGLGPVEYVDLADSPDTTRSCVKFGLFLLRDGDRRSAALIRGDDPHGPMQNALIEVIAEDREFASGVLAELKRLSIEHSVLRGQVLGLGPGEGNQYGSLRFMRRPHLERGELVLPDATLEAIERHVVGIATHGERLKAAGQHLKRGVLLFGPPGTGKTHTVRYLLSTRQSVTAFVLSGQALALIGQACALARVMPPSIVILEDVDLIAGDRSFGPMGSNPLLFEVLNQIDGLGDDVDVTFLLTTNRVDILERALAERPGRVDAAVEIAPPDEDGRRRLLRLYGSGLGVDALDDLELSDAVGGTEGKTATYLREVVRRAALLAAEATSQGALRVTGEMLATAAAELLEDRSALTRSLLGGPSEPDAEPPMQDGMVPPGAMQMMRRMRHQQGFGTTPPTPFAPDS